MSGPSRSWTKVKCPNWRRANAERHRLFEGHKKPVISEAERDLRRKREELRRVLERLHGPDLRPGIARAAPHAVSASTAPVTSSFRETGRRRYAQAAGCCQLITPIRFHRQQ